MSKLYIIVCCIYVVVFFIWAFNIEINLVSIEPEPTGCVDMIKGDREPVPCDIFIDVYEDEQNWYSNDY